MIVGMGSSVEIAGALVSPLISAPKLLDFLLGRTAAAASFAFPFALDRVAGDDCTTRSGKFSR
jgi:hypothetical protein